MLVKTKNTEISAASQSIAHHTEEGFKNTSADFTNDVSIFPLIYRYLSEKRTDPQPAQAIPVKPLTVQQLNQLPIDQDVVIRLGHSSIYLQIAGQKWLIDPVFSERASPFSFVGPKRFHQPPIDLSLLENIDGVLISHDHYDHLDKQSVEILMTKVKHFVVPLGVNKHLQDWGVPENNITALDWWEGIEFGELKLTATPTQHFSGRGILDKNKTLWASYVIQSATSSIYFSGDSGYFSGFKEIGERFGPFDLTMIETGAYDKDWASIHMTPEQSLQAHLDLGGKTMMPIHNGTFDLAFHSWYEPLQRISELALQKNVALSTPIFGSIVDIKNVQPSFAWWLEQEQNEFVNISETAL
jgi:L-ascorbate metabolism protein UlaG (beta-lactamase superfamily)